MAYLAYVLVNPCKRIYVGHTSNIGFRLARHNEGLVRSTAAHRPWRVLFVEEFDTRAEAMRREKQLKGGQGRAYIREILGSSTGPPEAD